MAPAERLQKILSAAGLASRRAGEESGYAYAEAFKRVRFRVPDRASSSNQN